MRCANCNGAFGMLDEAAQTHIRALPLEQLEDLSDALLDFSALADLTAWLQQHPLAADAPNQPAGMP